MWVIFHKIMPTWKFFVTFSGMVKRDPFKGYVTSNWGIKVGHFESPGREIFQNCSLIFYVSILTDHYPYQQGGLWLLEVQGGNATWMAWLLTRLMLMDKWVFPKIPASQNGWFIMENLIKWMIWD